jgi:hypothetical protein
LHAILVLAWVFWLSTQQVPRSEPKDGEVEVEVIYLSVDPYMRVGGGGEGANEIRSDQRSDADSQEQLRLSISTCWLTGQVTAGVHTCEGCVLCP